MNIKLNYLKAFQPAYYARLVSAVDMVKSVSASSTNQICDAASKFSVSYCDIEAML